MSAAIDPITAEIIRNYLEAVTEEISKTMERTAVSNVYNEAHDYSCGVFFHDGAEVSLLARAAAIPSHIFASLVSVRTIVDHFAGDLHEGDVVVVSDPYMGGSHAPDWTVMRPVFHEGRPVFFPGVRAHMLDVGLSSTDRIAAFFGIAPASPGKARSTSAPASGRAQTLAKAAARAESPKSVQAIIEKALRAAGLMR